MQYNWRKASMTTMGLWHPALKEWRRCQACSGSQRKQAGHIAQQIPIQPSNGEYSNEQSTCFSKINSKRTIVTVKRRKWLGLGQAVTVELHPGRRSNQSNLIQPPKQRCSKQDTGPADLERTLTTQIFP